MKSNLIVSRYRFKNDRLINITLHRHPRSQGIEVGYRKRRGI